MNRASIIACLLTMSGPLAGQTPVIAGIVNSASYAPTVSPGAVVTLFGTNLASGVLSATSIPLPTQLGQTQVLLDGIPAPLFFVSPDQINFQVPWRYSKPPFGAPGVVVRNGELMSGASTLVYQLQAPGIFTADGSGCGQVVALNVAADGSVSANGPSNSASPGQFVTLFVVGQLPDFYFTVADGESGLSALGTPSFTNVSGDVITGGKFPIESYVGLAPGLVGVFQINFQLAADAPEGCSVPIQLHAVGGGNSLSQVAAISVHEGGGQCQDVHSPYRAGSLQWTKTVATGIDPPPPSESFNGQFTDVALAGFYPSNFDEVTTMRSAQCHCYSAAPLKGPLCQFLDQSLDAGTLKLQTAGGASYSVSRGSSGYQATLPTGTIGAGAFNVSSAGGKDIGAFSNTLTLPPYPPIQITTDLSPGTVISSTATMGAPHGGGGAGSFTVNWTGGRAEDQVQLEVFAKFDPTSSSSPGYCECVAPANQGTITLQAAQVAQPPPFYPTGTVEVRIAVEPDGSQTQTFTADGITQGIQQRWVYEWRFGKIIFL